MIAIFIHLEEGKRERENEKDEDESRIIMCIQNFHISLTFIISVLQIKG